MTGFQTLKPAVKILAVFSLVNIASIFFIVFYCWINNNNHFGIAPNQFLLLSSMLSSMLSLFLRSWKWLLLNLVSLCLSICLNLFNISIDYQQWIERQQPTIFQFYT